MMKNSKKFVAASMLACAGVAQAAMINVHFASTDGDLSVAGTIGFDSPHGDVSYAERVVVDPRSYLSVLSDYVAAPFDWVGAACGRQAVTQEGQVDAPRLYASIGWLISYKPTFAFAVQEPVVTYSATCPTAGTLPGDQRSIAELTDAQAAGLDGVFDDSVRSYLESQSGQGAKVGFAGKVLAQSRQGVRALFRRQADADEVSGPRA